MARPVVAGHLSRNDLLLIALGVIPGAILAGRLGYVLVHVDYYASHGSEWLDPAQGSMELGIGVVGGTIGGLFVARQLSAPVRRWLHLAAAPLLVGLGLGKVAMAAGGEGQGVASDAPWATAYLGPGPWGSLGPEIASHPAQIYEGLLTLLALGLLLAMHRAGRFRDADGRAFFAALYMWAVARSLAATFWRDPPVLGPFSAGQLIAIAIAVIALGLWLSSGRQRQITVTDRALAAVPVAPPGRPPLHRSPLLPARPCGAVSSRSGRERLRASWGARS